MSQSQERYIRVPDVYYTTQMHDGFPPERGIALQAPQFYQGEDVVFDIYLNYNNEPVSPEKWIITAICKKSIWAVDVIWEGTTNNGVYQLDKPGFYRVWIPSEVTARPDPANPPSPLPQTPPTALQAGTYWVDLKITEKVGQGGGVKDLDVIIARTQFQLDYSAASPSPHSASARQKLLRDGQNPSYPPPTDTTRA